MLQSDQVKNLKGTFMDVRLVSPVRTCVEKDVDQTRPGSQLKRYRHVIENTEIPEERVQLKRSSDAECGYLVRLLSCDIRCIEHHLP